MPTPVKALATRIEEGLLERNRVCETLFSRELDRLARACREMAGRFLQGGRLLAFGRGPFSTDAQHVSVEFVHPVIVGKRALRLSTSQPPSALGWKPSLNLKTS